MATITEDYVSFEIAKLLKEKGFDEPCVTQYDKRGNFEYGIGVRNSDLIDNAFKAPTLQMVMKWLREVHEISIEIQCSKGNAEAFIMTIEELPRCLCRGISSNNYEQTAEAAIKYCLENLILITMAKIIEDYVSFETAKLLKEKGFDEICYLGYNKNGEYFPTSNRTNSQIIQPDFCFICCPTLQMAMKWLREVHKIYIDTNIRIILEQWAGYDINIYTTNTNNCLLDKVISLKGLKDNTSYEQACEAAIKYCLENLI